MFYQSMDDIQVNLHRIISYHPNMSVDQFREFEKLIVAEVPKHILNYTTLSQSNFKLYPWIKKVIMSVTSNADD